MDLSLQSNLTPINAWLPGRRVSFVKPDKEWLTQQYMQDLLEDEFWELTERVWDYTALSITALYNLYRSCRFIIDNRIDGDIIECGVFFGGAIMFAAEIFRRHDYAKSRRILGFDTFYGFARRSEHDIDFHGAEVCHPGNPEWDFEKEARRNVESIGFDPSRLHLIKGDVFQTLPAFIDRPIALLRLDTDTYDTTKCELETCWPKLVDNAPVIIDDYGWCLGARKATDDFLIGKGVLLHRIDVTVRSFVKPCLTAR